MIERSAAILVFLLEKDRAGFEEIATEIGNRTTANTHLKRLYSEGFVAKEYGRKGKYYLTHEGLAEAKNCLNKKVLKELPTPILTRFMMAYKKFVIDRLSTVTKVENIEEVEGYLQEELGFSEEEIIKLWLVMIAEDCTLLEDVIISAWKSIKNEHIERVKQQLRTYDFQEKNRE